MSPIRKQVHNFKSGWCTWYFLSSDWPQVSRPKETSHCAIYFHLCFSAQYAFAYYYFFVMFEVSVWCFDWMPLSAKEALQTSCLLDKHQTDRKKERKCVTLCIHRLPMSGMVWGLRTVVISSTWTLTLISILSICINFCPENGSPAVIGSMCCVWYTFLTSLTLLGVRKSLLPEPQKCWQFTLAGLKRTTCAQ